MSLHGGALATNKVSFGKFFIAKGISYKENKHRKIKLNFYKNLNYLIMTLCYIKPQNQRTLFFLPC
jgi:hypothetical protein